MLEHGCKTNGGTVDGEQPGCAIVQSGWLKGQQETVVMGDGFDVAPKQSLDLER